MTRLVWKKDQEEKPIVEEAVRLCRHDPTTTIGDALYLAQRLLPEDRRKEFFTPHYKRVLFDHVQTEIERQVKGGVPKQFPLTMRSDHVPEAQPVAAPVAPPPPAPIDPLAALPDLMRILGASIGKALAEHAGPGIAEHVGTTVRDALWAAMGARRPNGNDHPAVEKAEPAPATSEIPNKLPAKFDKHKVCVIGFPDSYRKDLQQHHPHLDFRFVDGGAPAHVAKTVSQNCEATFYMVKGASHKPLQGLKSGGFVKINGSVSDLKRVLHGRYPRTLSMEPAGASH